MNKTKYFTPFLLGIIMIAGGMATIPIEQASTVHTTIQAAQGTPFVVTDTISFTGAAIRDSELDCITDCIITSIIVQATASDTANNIAHIQNIEVDGAQLITDQTNPGNGGTAAIDVADDGDCSGGGAGTAEMDDCIEDLFDLQPASQDLITATGASTPVDALAQIPINVLAGAGGMIVPNTAGTADIVVEIDGVTIGTSATIVVTYSGWMVGTTEPTADDVASTGD